MTDTEKRFKRLMTRKQTAELLGVKVSWLERNTKTGPPYSKKTGRPLYDRDAVLDWLFEEKGEQTDGT